jgi:hypothetical protein
MLDEVADDLGESLDRGFVDDEMVPVSARSSDELGYLYAVYTPV